MWSGCWSVTAPLRGRMSKRSALGCLRTPAPYQGDNPAMPKAANCSDLSTEAAHLAQFQSDHARTLRRDAERLCEKLSKEPDVRCCFWDFELEHGRHVHFVENADTGELLTILHAVDSRKVTPEEWAALWGTDVESERARRRQIAADKLDPGAL
jgi:hypothetical protein